jgi:hypothetical protein
MSYIGNSPALKYASFEVQHFTTSATTSYALSNSVANENEIALFINNVRQQPGSSYAYTAAGTTLTLSAATTTSDTMYCVFIGKAVQTVTPAEGSVTNAMLSDMAANTVKVRDANSSGAPSDKAVANTEILIGDGTGFTAASLSSDVTMTNAGVVTIAAGAVTGDNLNDDAISAQGALGAEPADTDEFLVSDAGVLKRVDYSYIKPTAQVFRPNAQSILLNGDMAVAQRGTSATGKTGGGFYTCDRNEISCNVGTWTIIQEALTSGNAYEDAFGYAWRIDCTASESPAAGDEIIFQIPIEGQDLQLFKKGTSSAEKWTLAFWVKCSKTGTGQVNLSTFSRMCAATYTISSADTWEHKVLNYAADTTGTIPNDNSEEMRIEWWLDSGTNYNTGTAPTAWETESNPDRNASGTLDLADSTSNDWAITGIQLEVGEYTSSDLPPFQHESYGDNLRRCQRYYYMLDPLLHGNNPIGMGSFYTTTTIYCTFDHKVNMRAEPTGDLVTGTSYFNINAESANKTFDTISYSGNTTTGNLYGTGLTSTTEGVSGRVRFNNPAARIAADAEL